MSVRSHTDTPVGRLAHWLDVRLGAAHFTRSKLNYVFPEHFSFLFGEVALYSFVVLVATGIFLSLFYSPSEAKLAYDGAYAPLQGVRMTEAYASVLELSFSVRAGLLVRQTHHWAALVFLGAIVAHLCRVFFTGAFRRPRELNWMTGVVLLIVAMTEGYAGYSLLDDLLSGTGVRIGYSIVESLPVVGTRLAFLLWGGEFPGDGFLSRLFVGHIFALPALIAALIGVHLALIVRQKHTQFAGPGKHQGNVVGAKMWPTYATMSTGLFLLVAGALTLMGGLLQINPVWLYGPYDVFAVSSGSQADWYVLWLQGALRLMPGWSLQVFGNTFANQFFPAVLLPGMVFGLLLVWPFLEAWMTGDHREHHLLDRPRDRPWRTAIGVAALAWLGILLLAGSDDVFATTFDWAIVTVRRVERVLVVVVPVAAGAVAWKLCHDLQARERLSPAAEHTDSRVASHADADEGMARAAQPGRRRWTALGLAAVAAAALVRRSRRRRR